MGISLSKFFIVNYLFNVSNFSSSIVILIFYLSLLDFISFSFRKSRESL